MDEKEWTEKRKEICDMIVSSEQIIKYLKEELSELDCELLITLHDKHKR